MRTAGISSWGCSRGWRHSEYVAVDPGLELNISGQLLCSFLYQAELFLLTSGGIKISLKGWGFFPSGGPQSSVYHDQEGAAVGVESGWPHRVCHQEGGKDGC